jgi:hypothetical protein
MADRSFHLRRLSSVRNLTFRQYKIVTLYACTHASCLECTLMQSLWKKLPSSVTGAFLCAGAARACLLVSEAVFTGTLKPSWKWKLGRRRRMDLLQVLLC